MKTTQPQIVDVAIIGGGIAGCTAAIALSKNYNVAVIEKLAEPQARIGECLAPAARRILKRLDLLDGIENIQDILEQKIKQTHHGMQSYWGSHQVQVVDALRNPDGFGWQLNRKAFEIYLRAQTQNRGASCYWGYQLFQCQPINEGWLLTFMATEDHTQKMTIQSKFVIDASGRQSHFARKIGIQRTIEDKLIAAWATMSNEEVSKLSTITAAENGWWYSAPLPNKQRVLAFQTDSDLMERNHLKTKEAFLELANTNPQVQNILSKNKQSIHYHGIVAANSSRLNQVTGSQWAALGDAALSFDPLSSQGMFNAMASAIQLTDLMEKLELLSKPNQDIQIQFQQIYSVQINQIWIHYLKHKKIFYEQEQRWKHSEFWQRRHSKCFELESI